MKKEKEEEERKRENYMRINNTRSEIATFWEAEINLLGAKSPKN